MPTGTGKSVVIAEFLREALNQWKDTRVIVLTHVKELIQQNFNAMIRAWPCAPAGIYSAGLGERDISAQVIFAGIQSIYKRAYEVQRCDLVLIDEAHLLRKSDAGMYRDFLRELKEINPSLKIIGLTATPYRMDQGLLTEGEDSLFSDIAIDIPILRMIEEGYLSPLIPKQTKTKLDVKGVKTRGGEFIAAELEAAVNKHEITSGAVDEIIKAGIEEERGSWLIFCSGVSHAKAVCEEIKKRGISCETISGETPTLIRDQILRDFKEGNIRALTNMNVLTTGFDASGIDLIGMLRPTKSQSLYVQMLGRGTRLAEGKDDCLVLDFAGNTYRHGPVDQIKPKTVNDKNKSGEAPVKVCPDCQMIVAASAMTCINCGHQFPPREIKITRIASTAPILSSQIKDEWIEVADINYAAHYKIAKPTSMRVTYKCEGKEYNEWICFEHTGYPRQKAEQWWMKRVVGVQIVPKNVKDAMDRKDFIKKPSHIRVRPDGKYFSIVGYKFE